MSSPPFNHTMHQSAYNPSYRRSTHRPGDYSDDEYDYHDSESPERSHPVHPTFDAQIPRDIRRTGQFTPHERYAPPGVYDPSLHRAPDSYGAPLSQRQSHGTPLHQQDRHLVPYPARQSYESPSSQYKDYRTRDRSGSVASHSSHQSHRSHRSSTSHRSDRSKYDRDGSRKSKHVEARRPTMSDSFILLWNSVKGAFDSRK